VTHAHLVESHEWTKADAKSRRTFLFDGDRFWQILLQKSFWGGDRKFPEPLMFCARDVADHIVSSKIDHEPP
jgi:hypothetical protein